MWPGRVLCGHVLQGHDLKLSMVSKEALRSGRHDPTGVAALHQLASGSGWLGLEGETEGSIVTRS